MIGSPRRRIEDGRLITGAGRYVDDLRLPESLHCVVVRSQHAHARIRGVELAEAVGRPGVVGVFRLADLPELRTALPSAHPSGMSIRPHIRAVLADDLVRHVGEPVAVVVAEDRFTADDAAAAITVDYEVLATVSGVEDGLRPDAPLLHPEWGTNLAGTLRLETGAVERALAASDLVVARRIVFHRLAATALEPRAVAARWDAATATLDVWSATQAPHRVREHVARALGLDPQAVHVRTGDVGGGFGPKGQMYPEEIIVAALARRLRRPVRWTDTRTQSFISTMHAGDQVHLIRLGVTRDGRFTGLADDFTVDNGAYLPAAGIAANNTAAHLAGLYRWEAFRCRGRVVVTNKVPSTPYRGAGRSEAVLALERVIDIAARQLGLDPVDLRRRNLLTADELPHARGFAYRDGQPIVYDHGDYPALLDCAVSASGYWERRKEQAAARGHGRLIGIGVATYTEGTGIGPHEGAMVTVDKSGRVTVTVPVSCQGQSHETTLAQVCADRLGVAIEDITLVGGDTARFPAFSSGTNASRVAVIVGNAVAAAADVVRDRIARIAAEALECDPNDIVVDGRRAHVRGAPDRGVALSVVATRAEQPDAVRAFGEPGLTATRFYAPDTVTWAPGVHIATVEVDPDTGAIAVLAYTAVHDSGRAINPAVVEGQIHGGITGSLMDYGLPRADVVPAIDVRRLETPSRKNPLGVKGTGHGSAIPPPAAIANAVTDALAAYGADITEVPVRPETVWTILRRGEIGCRNS